MKILINNETTITKAPGSFLKDGQSRLTMPNPQWEANDQMNRWNGNTPRRLEFFRKNGNSLVVPRGFTGQLLQMAHRAGIPYHLDDQRRILPEVDFTFTGQLRDFQKGAVSVMLRKDFGILSAATGSGKTIMALKIIVERRQPCLVIVHTKELLHQWCDRIESFLNIPKADIGIIGDGKKRIGEKITVGIVNSIYPFAGGLKHHFGHIIVDECHRTPSRTFTEAVSAFDSRYMLGLSATPWRRDGLSKLIFWHIGDVHHEVDKSALVDSGDILRADVITRETDFIPYHDATEEYSRMLSELTEDKGRNALIVSDVIREASNGGGVCLVLSDRKSHCDTLGAMIAGHGIMTDILTGEVKNGERKAVVERLDAGNVKVLIATGQLIGEGFDAKSLQTLFLATPIKFSGRLIQYLGRVMRPAPGKDYARVYDYIDANVGVLMNSARARARVYQQT